MNYGRHILKNWAIKHVEDKDLKNINILDIGVGGGDDLLSIKNNLSTNIDVHLKGLDCRSVNIEKCKLHGIRVDKVNLEYDTFPYADNQFDIVIANQILEHTKEVFWIISEISRVSKNNSIIVIGVPNLGSFHNRIALLLGMQPTCIEPLSAHVRGFTVDGLKRLFEYDNYLRLIDYKDQTSTRYLLQLAVYLASSFLNFPFVFFLNL